LKEQEVNGKTLHKLTKEELRSIGIPLGPASSLVQEIEELKQNQEFSFVSWREPYPLVTTSNGNTSQIQI